MTKYFDLHAPLVSPFDWHVTAPDTMNMRDVIKQIEGNSLRPQIMWGRQVHRGEPLEFQEAVDLT
jgi:hypothetical protein